MPARLIVNADDFGLTPGINRAVEELFRAGALSSATLMATGPAFDDAVAIAHRNPGLGVGCHLVFADGVPVLPPAEIPSLHGPDRTQFRPSLGHFVAAASRGAIAPEHITREAIAQIRRLQQAGLHVTHVDTHKHTHLFPGVLRQILIALEATGVPALRNPFEPAWAHALGHGGRLRRTQLTALRRLGTRFHALGNPAVHTTGGTIGIAATGHLDLAALDALLDAVPATGTFELVCHPGYHDAELDQVRTRLRSSRETELRALLASIPERCRRPGAPALVSFAALAPQPAG